MGLNPHPPYPLSQGEGGKPERRGGANPHPRTPSPKARGASRKGEGGKLERGKVFYLNFTSAYIPILR